MTDDQKLAVGVEAFWCELERQNSLTDRLPPEVFRKHSVVDGKISAEDIVRKIIEAVEAKHGAG